ncbi:polymorphic toxin type 23 domain-containing protein [Dysgonomonas macrotermitis]|nr:polymorphic toxin type 23 domain-containing protein [Dysgonomonas macrotermitis]
MKKSIIYIITICFVCTLSILSSTLFAKADGNTTYLPDTSKDVGDIPYEIKVTPQGALTYTVPIECYQSPNGLQPNISLVYNSMAGMGSVGMGWSIGGISAITRVNSSNYYDGEVRAANLSDTCSFSLDGIRLVKQEGTSFLITEQGNILVKPSIEDDGNFRFEVFYPNGNKATYRSNWLAGSQTYLSYPITKMEDKVGNFISYEYEFVNGIAHIKHIYYYAANNFNQIGSVHFQYTPITSKGVPFFFDGVEVSQTRLLNRIQIQGVMAANDIYDINLSYKYVEEKDTYYLEKIGKKHTGSNKELNPLTFTYGKDKEENLNITQRELTGYPTTLDSIVSLIPVKFSSKEATNGLIVMPEKSIFNWAASLDYNIIPGFSGYASGGNAYIYKNVSDTKALPLKLDLNSPFFIKSQDGRTVQLQGHFRGLYTIDHKGDGNNVIFQIVEKTRLYDEYKDISTQRFTFWRGENFETKDSITIDIPEKHVMYKNKGETISNITRSYLVGDFIGDGYERLLYITHHKDFNEDTRASSAIVIDFNQNAVIYNKECFDVSYGDIVCAIDFDGDGKNEIFHMNDKGMYVYKFTLDTGFTKIAGYDMPYMLPSTNNKTGKIGHIYLFGDMNGDGKTDVIRSPISKELANDKDYWTYYFSNGRDGFVHADYTLEETAPFYSDNKYILQDVDGNGLPDLVMLDQDGIVSIYKNIKGQFRAGPIVAPDKIDKRSKLVISRVREANKLYPVMGIKEKNLALINNSVNEQEDRLMATSVNSYGVETKYTYGTLTNKEICSVGEQDTVPFPYNYLIEDIFVLKDIKTELNGANISSGSYKYHNPVVHRQGLGFRGFEQVAITDNLRGKTTIQNYDPLKFGVLTSVQTPTMTVKSDYDALVAKNKQLQLLLKKEVQQDLLRGTSVTSNFKYDTYGNLTNKSVDYGDGINNETSYKLENIDNGSSYILGLLKEEQQTSTRAGASSSSKAEISYNNLFLPVSKKNYYNNNQVSEEAYVYDASNNLQQLQSRNYTSADWLTTKYEYDTYGRKVKETDPLGLFTVYEYGGKDRLQSVKNHKGHTISYTYDSWGNNTLTTYADGTTESMALNWETSPQGAVFSITTKKSGEPASKIYYDALGREIRTGSQRFDGSYLYTDNIYDELGRLQKTSLPFKSGSPSLWNESSYDTYDRIKSVTYASGKKDTYAYNKLKVKSVIDGIGSLKTYDTSGEVIRVADASGSIMYNYRPDGQPKSIVAPGDITTSFEYDQYGRQTAIIDPSAGTKRFGYDLAGNINKETDARGKVTNLTYDKYGRLTKKEVVGEFTTTHQYTADNLLESEISTNGTARTYTYDNLFRLKTQKESILDGKWLEKTFDYLSDGNVGSISYKSQSGNIATENYEYTNGHHTGLKLDNTLSVWKLTAENDLGMPTASLTGNIERGYTYDAYGLPTGRTLKNGSSIIQNFGYKFDAKTGNLLWRKDNTRNIQEDFVYDDLNRLTRFGSTTIQYNNQGNIIDHSAIGYFSYSKNKPYAIEKVQPYTENLPQHQQDITYNAQMRPVSIAENGYKALFSYDTDGNRIKMNLMRNDTLQRNRYYVGGIYEIDETLAGTSERLYLGGDAYSAAAVYVKEASGWTVNYIGRDYLGSITHVMDQTGVVRQELSYDPWGRFRNPVDQALYDLNERVTLVLGDRGYTGHEHLSVFGLINMNARLYDPVIGRFLSPDPYVQAPDFSQNFNRYSYALNNPFRYTDPNGEFAFIPIAIIAAAAFATGYVAHGIATGNWGMAAIYSGGLSALASGIAASTMGVGTLSGALVFAGKDVANTLLSNIIKPIPVNVPFLSEINGFGVSISPVAMLTAGVGSVALGGGFRIGAAVSVSQKIGDWTLMANGSMFGGGAGNNLKNTLSGGFAYDDGKRGFSYMFNRYNYSNEPGGKQSTGTIGVRYKDLSIKHENDLFARSGDKQRTAALEVGYKGYSAGFNIYTTDPSRDEYGVKMTEEHAQNRKGVYDGGYQLASPFYIGVRQGNSTTKIGMNIPQVGWFQNAMHRYLTKNPDFHYGTYKNNFIQKGTWTNSNSLYTY